MEPKMKRMLRRWADRYETSAFSDGDPLHFPHSAAGRLATPANIEATALVASVFAFGSIRQFMPKIALIRDAACGDMDTWVRAGDFSALPAGAPGDSFYRFATHGEVRSFLAAYSELLRRHGTLGAYVRERCGGTGPGAVCAIQMAFAGRGCGCLVPQGRGSACKRICMFLRWMVRSGSPVDLGLWADFIDRRTLPMPLDVHVMRQAAALGLLATRNATMSAAIALSETMKEAFPDDPLRGDFALYGAGRFDTMSPCAKNDRRT